MLMPCLSLLRAIILISQFNHGLTADGSSIGGFSGSDDSDDDNESVVTTSTYAQDEPDVSTNTIVHHYASVVDAVRWVIRRCAKL